MLDKTGKWLPGTNTVAYLASSSALKEKMFCNIETSGLYYKNIFTIASDDHKWSLYYSVIYDRHLTLASIINYDRKWCYNLERHTSGVNYDRNKFII